MTRPAFADRFDTERFVLVHKDGTLLFPYKEKRADARGGYSFVAGTGRSGGKRDGEEIFVDTVEELVLLAVRDGKPVCARPLDRSKGAAKYSLRTGTVIAGYGLAEELAHLVDGLELKPRGTVDSIVAEARTAAPSGALTSARRNGEGLSKVARISYNSAEWTRATGDARRQEDDDTYNARMGFGHEDWLFRNEWLLEGWRYAFIQGVNKSHAKLVREGLPFNILLFTVLPDKSRRYVAHVSDVECLSDDQADMALEAFRANGWFDRMREEIEAVGGTTSALQDQQWSRHVLNVRFRLDKVRRLDSLAPQEDPIHRLNRYVLYDATAVGLAAWRPPLSLPGRTGSTQAPVQAAYVRAGVGPIVVTPEHARMQKLLGEQLASEFPEAIIRFEDERVDVILRQEDRETLFEIKTDLSPKTVLREAIGQLLEYGHRGGTRSDCELRLVAVGRTPLGAQDEAYLEVLRSTYGLPLEYRVVKL